MNCRAIAVVSIVLALSLNGCLKDSKTKSPHFSLLATNVYREAESQRENGTYPNISEYRKIASEFQAVYGFREGIGIIPFGAPKDNIRKLLNDASESLGVFRDSKKKYRLRLDKMRNVLVLEESELPCKDLTDQLPSGDFFVIEFGDYGQDGVKLQIAKDKSMVSFPN